MNKKSVINGIVGYVAAKLVLEVPDIIECENDFDDELLIILRRKSHSKIRDYIENTVMMYDVDDFKSHFRMSRKAVEVNISKNHINY